MLDEYEPDDPQQARLLGRFHTLIQSRPDCYERTCFDPGHITGSALLLSHDCKRVLLNHHRFLNKWLCFGGHADGEKNIYKVALREASKESGINNIEPVFDYIFDLDIHRIPENPEKGEPEHWHYDVRFLLKVQSVIDEKCVASAESLSLKWCRVEEALSLAADDDMQRLLLKWSKAV